MLTLTWLWLYCTKHFTYTNLFNPQNNNMRQILLPSPFYRWVRQLVSGRIGVQTRVDWLLSLNVTEMPTLYVDLLCGRNLIAVQNIPNVKRKGSVCESVFLCPYYGKVHIRPDKNAKNMQSENNGDIFHAVSTWLVIDPNSDSGLRIRFSLNISNEDQ